MTDQIPLKVIRTLGDTTALGEFEIGEEVGIVHGGTGADNATDARTNLGALGAGDSITQLDATAWTMFYADGSGDIQELPQGANNDVLTSNGPAAAPSWQTVSGTGDVVGPGSSTDEAVARFDGATGKLIQDSAVLIDDVGNITGVNNITLAGTVDGRDVAADGTTQDSHIADATIHFTEASIDHTAITNIGVNSHAAIDSHIADATIHFTEASIDHTAIANIGVNSHAAIDSHIADATIHFTEASIDHTAIANIGTNTHAQIDTHIADATIHFTEASIDHTAISNIGTNTHAQIDTHIADATIHFTEASIDHTAISNIGTNTHAQIDTHIADTSIHFADAPADAQDYVRNNNAWVVASGSGDVVGPASATDNAIARYDGATGKLIQNSSATIDDSGNLTANNVSGTNTGDQTITLTGDVTGSGTGSFAATIANDAVTNAKLANMAGFTVKAKPTTGSGDPVDLSVGTNTVLGRVAGDIVAAQLVTAQVANDAIDNTKIANMAQSTIKGRAVGAGTGDPVDLTATQATAILNNFTSALKGLAPASGGGTTNFLRADATWAAPVASKVVFSTYIEGTTANPSTNASTVATAPVLAEMTYTFTPADATNRIEVFFSGSFENSKDNGTAVGIFIDGTVEDSTIRTEYTGDDVDFPGCLMTFWQGTLSAVSHTITVRFWVTNNGTSENLNTFSGNQRAMMVREVDE